jgi:hypothetical protein
MVEPLYEQTIDVAVSEGVLTAEPDSEAARSDLASAATTALEAEGLDVTGSDWERQEITLKEGGN